MANGYPYTVQTMNIRHFITAEAWQKGRIERHGAIVKSMLDRTDAEKPIESMDEFEKCLHVCIQAENSLAKIRGFSPEQLVLGKATQVPASPSSDEQLGAHTLAEGQGDDSEVFRKSLERRACARRAFFLADSDASIRRALLRRSRPTRGPYAAGQFVLY